jgi:2-polyprenyl-3-methyl-5-hydroxy-6-metoxy-1,4-benzoquinol methylase
MNIFREVMMIDDPTINNNREYNYTDNKTQYRGEYPIIEGLIKPNSKVIDLGCGNGSLLKLLKDKKKYPGIWNRVLRCGDMPRKRIKCTSGYNRFSVG